MVSKRLPDTTYALIERLPEDALIRTSFSWQPSHDNQDREPDTYTIALGTHASLELDKQIVARLRGLTLHEASAEDAQTVLGAFIGESLVGYIRQASSLGFVAVSTEFNHANLLAIARLQAEDPSTPPRLRRGCTAMLDGNSPMDNSV